MGGLRTQMPVAFWAFLIGGCSLAGVPIVTAGFYSKGLIVWSAWASDRGSPWLWAASVLGAFLTSLYIFRLIFIVFYGEPQMRAGKGPGYRMVIPVAALSLLSIVGGFVQIPPWMGNVSVFTNFLSRVLPDEIPERALGELGSEAILTTAIAIGLALAAWLFLKRRAVVGELAKRPFARAVHQLWLNDWGMDVLYNKLFVQPVLWFVRIDRNDFIDRFYDGIAALCRDGWEATRASENGLVRWYATSIAIGTIIFIVLAIIL
jgi:NADH-quinone oxidoreductase subunit L